MKTRAYEPGDRPAYSVLGGNAFAERSYKVGVNKGRPRIWIDGRVLADAGFVGGVVYSCYVEPGRITLVLEAPVLQRGRRVTGRPGGKPIIDLLGRDVESAFPNVWRVTATFEPGRIVIRAAE